MDKAQEYSRSMVSTNDSKQQLSRQEIKIIEEDDVDTSLPAILEPARVSHSTTSTLTVQKDKKSTNSSQSLSIKQQGVTLRSGSASTQASSSQQQVVKLQRQSSVRRNSGHSNQLPLIKQSNNTEHKQPQATKSSASLVSKDLLRLPPKRNISNNSVTSTTSSRMVDNTTPEHLQEENKENCCDNLSEVSEESAYEENEVHSTNQIHTSNQASTNQQSETLDDKSKKKQTNIRILASMPNNAKEQEEIFFKSNFTVNPVFEYDNPQIANRFISQFKKPRCELMPIATKILEAFLAEYQSETNYLQTEGRVITDRDETEGIFKAYLEDLGLLDVAQINFSDKIVAPTSVTYDNYSPKIRINIQLPIEYREGRIQGVLHHEIGTHFLRRYNETQQEWHGKRKKYGLKSCIAIEEGMGCINMMLEQAKECAAWVLGDEKTPLKLQQQQQEEQNEAEVEENANTQEVTSQEKQYKRMPYLFKPSLNYYACYKASELSFVELFDDLARFVDNPKQRWKYVLRVKRGLSDTSQPGGLYKDQVYLEGAVKLLKARKTIDFKAFYCGKINLEDIKRPKFIRKAQLESVILPKFMSDMREYRRQLDVIAKLNFID